ncbi:MAG: phosphotransferase, partial [Ilumatobacteraceae bacterium]
MGDKLKVPSGVADLTASWITAAMGAAAAGAVVTDVVLRPIGNGMVADSVRLQLTWDRPTEAPPSLVAKVPAADEVSRGSAAATRTYLLEAAFYNDLADTLAVNRPRCYKAMHDPQTNDYVVLLEDLAPAEAGDQIAGCSVDQAALVIPELAALHGPRWCDPALKELPWLDAPSSEAIANLQLLVSMVFPGFLERYSARLDPGVVALAERFVASLGAYLGNRGAKWTVAHGDFRLDNLLFGGPRVAVLDWQTVKIGAALGDVAYFIGSALHTEDRRSAEQDLVRDYHGRLLAAGGAITWDECWLG